MTERFKRVGFTILEMRPHEGLYLVAKDGNVYVFRLMETLRNMAGWRITDVTLDGKGRAFDPETDETIPWPLRERTPLIEARRCEGETKEQSFDWCVERLSRIELESAQ